MREIDMQDQINAWTGLFSALALVIGAVGTMVAGWLKGKGGLEATIDARFQALLDRQDAELQAKIDEVREKSELVKELEHAGRSCEERCSQLEFEQRELRHELAILRSRVEDMSDAEPV